MALESSHLLILSILWKNIFSLKNSAMLLWKHLLAYDYEVLNAKNTIKNLRKKRITIDGSSNLIDIVND